MMPLANFALDMIIGLGTFYALLLAIQCVESYLDL